MMKRLIRLSITLLILFAVGVTISPQDASAGTCKTYAEKKVAKSEWQCAENYINSVAPDSVKITGDKGTAGFLGCDVEYNYNPSNKELKFTVKSGFFCPISCSKMESEIGSYIDTANQKCRN